MNKYQEAKKYIDMIWSEPSWSRVDIDWLAIEQIKEILDRETPMKPVHSTNHQSGYCPICPNIIYRGDPRCWQCRQKIDWSDEK